VAQQFNDNKVDVYIYATERTLDTYKFNLLQNKQTSISQIKNNKLGSRSIDEGSIDEASGMNFAEYVAILSGDTNLLEKARLEKKISKETSNEENIEAKVYQFDKKNLYIPTDRLTTIKTSQDVAEFLSKQKRGTVGKLHVMVLDAAGHITRYFLADKNLSIEKLKNKLTVEAGKHGDRIVLASNGTINQTQIGVLSEHLGRIGIKLLDVLVIRQNEDILNNYISLAERGELNQATYDSFVQDNVEKYGLKHVGGAVVDLTSGKAIMQKSVPAKIGKVELSVEQREKFAKGDVITITGLTDKSGKTHTSHVRWNSQNNKIEFSNIKPIKQNQPNRIRSMKI
jgi:hypothetical protein